MVNTNNRIFGEMSLPHPGLKSSRRTLANKTKSTSIGTTLPESLSKEATSPPGFSQASKKNSPSSRPRMPSLGTEAQGRKKSSVATSSEAHCSRVDKQAQVAPLKKPVITGPSTSSLVASARTGKTTQRKATFEMTISGSKGKKAFGASKVDNSLQTETNVHKKRPSAAFMAARELKDSLGDTSLVLNQGLVRDNGKLPRKILRAALSSGQLNLSEKGLEKVPHQVWSINEPDEGPEQKSKGLSMDKIEEEEDSWSGKGQIFHENTELMIDLTSVTRYIK